MRMEAPLYQIVAGTPDGVQTTFPVANTPLTVGSDEACDMLLQGELIEPTHLRLAALPGRGLLLVNLAAGGRTRVNGAAVERASSIVWEVYQVVEVGGILLRLLPLSSTAPPEAKPVSFAPIARDTNATAVEDGIPARDEKTGLQDSESPSPSGTPRSATEGKAEGEGLGVRAGVDEPFPHLPRLPDDDDEPPTMLGIDYDDATPDKPLPAVVAPMPVMPPVGAQSVGAQYIAPLPSPAPLSSDTPNVPFLFASPEPPPALIPEAPPPVGLQSVVPLPPPVVAAPPQPAATHDERTRRTEVYLGAMPDEIAYVRPRETRGYETLVKDWHYAGTLGLQMTMREVRLAQGERVRVPFSISNDGVEPLQVQVYVTGLPKAWVEVMAGVQSVGAQYIAPLQTMPLLLNPGEVRLIDLVLQPHDGAPAQALPAAIYAHDVNAPHAKVSSTFQVTIKPQRDVVGWLQPVTVRTPGMTELVLQNHTQATARIFLSSGSADDRLRVTFDTHELQLPAGETVRVPVRLHVARRPLWRGWQAGWYASVKAGSRAAIVYEAVARVRPRIGWAWLVIVLLALVAAALIAVYVRG
jgi:hypothetical protein